MENSFSYLALAIWPIVSIFVFVTRKTLDAIFIVLIGGWLFLPEKVSIDLQYVPSLNKLSIAVLSIVLLTLVIKKKNPFAIPRDKLLRLLLLVVVLGPLLTLIDNREPIFNDARWVKGLNLYDVLSLTVEQVIFILPVLFGIKFVRTIDDLKRVIHLSICASILYVLPALFEVRFSPQLHSWVYGFFPHSFLQQMRYGGFRPVVFLSHGLTVAELFALCFLLCCATFRKIPLSKQLFRTLSLVLLFITMLLSKSLGAAIIAAIGGFLILFCKVQTRRFAIALFLGILVLYPLAKVTNIIPEDAIVDVFRAVDVDRAQSLEFRFFHEQRLVDRINTKPILGWGGWSRNMLEGSITDGFWLVVASKYGLLGLYSFFGLIVFACYRMSDLRSLRHIEPRHKRVYINTALVIAVYSILFIPNYPATPLALLFLGACIGSTYSFMSLRKHTISA